MHSISPYLLRCFDPNLPGNNHDKYTPLDRVRGRDTYALLEAFIREKTTVFKIVEASKQVYRFKDITFDSHKRQIYGWFQVGTYGIKTDIINIATGEVDFEKAQNNAEIINHYIHFFVPRTFDEGIAILHAYRSIGVKTLFYNIFKPYFLSYTNLNIQMNPLSYDQAINDWKEANAKEIKVTRFKGFADNSDALNNLGHHENELILRPSRNVYFGKLKDFFVPGSNVAQAVEVLSPMGTQVKTVVELNGKRRTFKVGHADHNTLCEIELDEDVVLVAGNPKLSSMTDWCQKILREYATSMYPNLEIEI